MSRRRGRSGLRRGGSPLADEHAFDVVSLAWRSGGKRFSSSGSSGQSSSGTSRAAPREPPAAREARDIEQRNRHVGQLGHLGTVEQRLRASEQRLLGHVEQLGHIGTVERRHWHVGQLGHVGTVEFRLERRQLLGTSSSRRTRGVEQRRRHVGSSGSSGQSSSGSSGAGSSGTPNSSGLGTSSSGPRDRRAAPARRDSRVPAQVAPAPIPSKGR